MITLSKRSVQSHSALAVVMTAEEREWFDGLCQRLGMKRQQLIRSAIQAFCVARGEPYGFREKGYSYDRMDPASGRAWRDRSLIFDRRANGESIRALAQEYGIQPGAMGSYMKQVARERGLTIHAAVGAATAEACERVLTDPFSGIGGRAREIAETLAAGSATYNEVAAAHGVTRQRVHQVAILCRKLANVSRADAFNSSRQATAELEAAS